MTQVSERQQKIGTFAAELHQLRVNAGTPSFRKIASISGCISHTTLAEAEKGLRLPSWETTREFVKACQGNEADWRRRWEKTKEAIAPPGEAVLTPRPSNEKRKRHLRIPLILGAVVLLGVNALVITIISASLRDSTEETEKSPKGTLIEGDQSTFIDDVTIRDKTRVRVGEKFTKVWKIMNTGKVIWRGRYLQRQDLPVSPDTCQTADKVSIGDTLPNEHTLISVQVTAPSKPTTCLIYWKMVDSQGREFFPTSRLPVRFWVYVVDQP